jgi:biopolymer transport protein TolR
MSRRNGLGKKRELDFELNLTSFIDLLSTCTCFLLITAVWIQIGTVEIKQSHGTEANEVKKETVDLDLVFKNPNELRLNLKKDGRPLKAIDVKSDSLEHMLAKLNDEIKTQIVNTKLNIGVATVTPRSTVNYGQLVSTLDILRKNKIVNIGVLTARGE